MRYKTGFIISAVGFLVMLTTTLLFSLTEVKSGYPIFTAVVASVFLICGIVSAAYLIDDTESVEEE